VSKGGITVMTYNEALDRLVEIGVVTTRTYWDKAASTMKYLDTVLINAATICNNTKSEETIQDFDEALRKCMEKKVFIDGGFWSKAAKTNNYVKDLIINISNYL
jgi:hypothetical protein